MIETDPNTPIPQRRSTDRRPVHETYMRPVVLSRRYLGATVILFVFILAIIDTGNLPIAVDLGPPGAATSSMTAISLFLLGLAFVLLRPGGALSFWWKWPTIAVALILIDSLATLREPTRVPVLAQAVNERLATVFGISSPGNLGADTGLILLALCVAVLARDLYRSVSFWAAVIAAFMTFASIVELINGVSFFGGYMAWTTALTLLPLSLAALALHTRNPMMRLILQKNQIGRRLRWQVAVGIILPPLVGFYFRLQAEPDMLDGQIDTVLITIISWSIILAAFRSARIDSEARHVRQKILIKLSDKMMTDELSGLLNRRGLEATLDESWSRYKHQQRTLALVMLDLDHFKAINDTYGHLAGDQLLARVGTVLRTNMRIEDCAGRWGGDEFLVLLKIDKAAEVIALTERIRNAISQIHLQTGAGGPGGSELLAVTVTISCGVSAFAPGDRAYADALARADQRLYRAKHAGRNKIEVDYDALNAVA